MGRGGRWRQRWQRAAGIARDQSRGACAAPRGTPTHRLPLHEAVAEDILIESDGGLRLCEHVGHLALQQELEVRLERLRVEAAVLDGALRLLDDLGVARLDDGDVLAKEGVEGVDGHARRHLDGVDVDGRAAAGRLVVAVVAEDDAAHARHLRAHLGVVAVRRLRARRARLVQPVRALHAVVDARDALGHRALVGLKPRLRGHVRLRLGRHLRLEGLQRVRHLAQHRGKGAR